MAQPIAEPGRMPAPEPGAEDAAPVRTLGRALVVFAGRRSPQVLVAGWVLAIATRCGAAVTGLAPVSRWDVAALALVALLVPFVEWSVHRVVLHARPRTIRGLRLDPGLGHREHHRYPASLDHVLLGATEATVFQVVNAGVATAVVGLPLALAGRPVLGPVLTGILGAVTALAHYEWSHFLFHTAYRPRSARYRRLKANHRRHHWRDQRSWLGITSNLADRTIGTLPRDRPSARFRSRPPTAVRADRGGRDRGRSGR